MKSEQKHLTQCLELIKKNIVIYEKKVEVGQKEVAELSAAVTSGDIELYDKLIVSKDIKEHDEIQLGKNRTAFHKPYFGRIDYRESESNQYECLYIGKNGVFKNKTEVIIFDWRAPVSTLYYENKLGKGSYEVPNIGEITVDLQLKRTFDILEGELLGYYDNDAVAADELLVKYLSQNKDVVLGDIISTIQKEQNEIIRQSPFRNIIVQGTAGSGKTTVSMHRISYILYNYKERFSPDEFCIVGSNDMLLNYITSGLPELDVRNVRQKRMDEFFIDLLGKEWKKKYKLTEPEKSETFKSKIAFIKELESYLKDIRDRLLSGLQVWDQQLGIILSEESVRNTVKENQNVSLLQIYRLLNERIRSKIKFLVPKDNRDFCKEKMKEYRGHFEQEAEHKDIVNIYTDFLLKYGREHEVSTEAVQIHVKRGRFDLYDTAALVLIQKLMTERGVHDEYGQVFIDEAQDFGAMVFYVMKQVLSGCYFTIMGDVSQNINYEMGMNHWEDLIRDVFEPERTGFHILAKSYRNTMEISKHAGKLLEKASFGQYKIEPVIRHGRDVGFYKVKENELAYNTAALIRDIQGRGYGTIAVICRNLEQAEQTEHRLGKYLELDRAETSNFQKGVMVLPIQLTKGLEFDAVILWNPDGADYTETERDAKILYVAVTRALHELHVVYSGELSALFG